jgi:cellulose synthase (UDP-forming)
MLRSLISAIKGEKVKFIVTPKEKQAGGNINLQHIWPHMAIIGLTVLGIIYNLLLLYFNMNPSPSGFASNTFWGLFNVVSLSVIIRAAYWNDWTEQPEAEPYLKSEMDSMKTVDQEKPRYSETEQELVINTPYSLASNA